MLMDLTEDFKTTFSNVLEANRSTKAYLSFEQERRLHIIETKLDWNKVGADFVVDVYRWGVVSFDAEWNIDKKGLDIPPDFIILGSMTMVLVVKVQYEHGLKGIERIPPALMHVLEDSNIIKIGSDIWKELKEFGLEDDNVIDCQQVAKDFDDASKQLGLRSTGFAEIMYTIYDKDPEVDYKTMEADKMQKLYRCVPKSFIGKRRRHYDLYSWTGACLRKLGRVQRRYCFGDGIVPFCLIAKIALYKLSTAPKAGLDRPSFVRHILHSPSSLTNGTEIEEWSSPTIDVGTQCESQEIIDTMEALAEEELFSVAPNDKVTQCDSRDITDTMRLSRKRARSISPDTRDAGPSTSSSKSILTKPELGKKAKYQRSAHERTLAEEALFRY